LRCALTNRDHDLADLWRQDQLERLLVEDTGLLVDGDNLCTEAFRSNALPNSESRCPRRPRRRGQATSREVRRPPHAGQSRLVTSLTGQNGAKSRGS
jgi:hypothetical protein